jgi:hypothetical protein
MQKSNVLIIWSLLLMGCISMVYFLSLPLHLPFPATAAIIGAAGIFIYGWLNKNITIGDALTNDKTNRVWQYLILLTGVFFITYNVWQYEDKYGCWDAWNFWNVHARYLADAHHWKLLYKYSFLSNSHPDYPLYLPGTIAFLWRLTGSETSLVPFGISFLVTLFIPVMIYLELYRKNLPLAAIVLFLFAFDAYYLKQGVQQYADTPLALLFLSAFICLQHYKAQRSNTYITIIAALAGCCIWTKNEGIMLVLLFAAFNFKHLFLQGRWKYFMAGIAIPLLVLIYFKNMTPATDLLASKTNPVNRLFDPLRYQLIKQYLIDSINQHFSYIKAGVVLYSILCVMERRFFDRNFILLLCCVLGYLLVYVLTPMDLEWQLSTSIDRVLHQLMPAFIYVLALRFSRVKWQLGNEQV